MCKIILGEQVEDHVQDTESTKDDSYRTVEIQPWHERYRDKILGHYQLLCGHLQKPHLLSYTLKGMLPLWLQHRASVHRAKIVTEENSCIPGSGTKVLLCVTMGKTGLLPPKGIL